MKRLLLSVLVAFISLQLVTAQNCIPDTSLKTPGYYPEHLPPAAVGQAYNESIQFHVPGDTVAMYQGTPVNATIDSVKVTGVLGMPNGFAYDCTPTNCVLPGGKVSCGRIYGTPAGNDIGIYPLRIPIVIYARISGFIPIQQPDTIKKYSIDINALSVKTIEKSGLRIYPNPVKNQLFIFSEKFLPLSRLVIFDQVGKEIGCPFTITENGIELSTNMLQPGIYHCTLASGTEQTGFRFIKE